METGEFRGEILRRHDVSPSADQIASDLNYLQKLPLSHLKLAKVAVHQISPQTRTGPMAKCLIDIGHNMNLTVIAECVETRAQMDFLRANGCDQMQGLYYKEPLIAEAAEQLLAAASA